MPLIPFVGLSILVHFLIIFYRFFYPRKNFNLPTNNSGLLRTWLGLFIVLGVFGFVLVPAVFLVRASVFDKHSLVNYIEDRAMVSNDNNLSNHSEKIVIRN